MRPTSSGCRYPRPRVEPACHDRGRCSRGSGAARVHSTGRSRAGRAGTPLTGRVGAMDRRVQLRELYGLEFPDELFELWAWYQGLPAEMKATFVEHGGMRPHGVCDVLGGKFDGVELRYPAVLHWRYR